MRPRRTLDRRDGAARASRTHPGARWMAVPPCLASRTGIARGRTGEVMARILLINDEPDLLFLFQIALEDAGHTVEALEEGSKALEVARRFRPEVIGLDWIIPDLSGEEVL